MAPEYEARLAKILAVEDENTMCLADGVGEMQAVAGAGMKGSINFDPSTKMHHDAMFTPTGPAVPQATVEGAPPPAPAPASVVAGVMGAAARARLVLTGKGAEEPTTAPKSTPKKTKTKTLETARLPKPRKDEGEQPLFKTLQVWVAVQP